ncbi:transcription initiation factor IIF [Massarina eburnea CBS 473.64]|uniref:Transcription initiation factor IIF subunit beta n=1 Tax=Massarina eburnea CBS 473.64 TaxID=1395130 RepID=A0A6A6RGT3_9PLEO|nr:transcription initiation factor IIF [Massarina eburnea CBS 473.64]
MNGIKPDPDVKMELDTHTPAGSGYMDDDFYEDTGELNMPIKGTEQDMWLTRVPDWLFAHISKWEDIAEGNDDDQIVLGEMLAFTDPTEKDGLDKSKAMRMFFNDRWSQKTKLPNAFELEPLATRTEVLKNTYIFCEKDLPGYRPNGVGHNKGAGGNGFGGGMQDPKSRIQKTRSKYRKAIPKQTALLGSSTRQYLAKPLNTREFMVFDAARHRQAILGTNQKTNIIEHNVNELNVMDKMQNKFNSFIRQDKKKTSQQNKAIRIAADQLIDMLHAMFDEYKYWPMKAIKKRTKQPEAYLKEVLGEIAELVRSGPFASSWTRSAAFASMASQNDEIPPEAGDIQSDNDDDDEMVDVVI